MTERELEELQTLQVQVENMKALCDQALAGIAELRGEASDVPLATREDLDKCTKLGYGTYLHVQMEQRLGRRLTRADSLKIRRGLPGDVRATANYFGRENVRKGMLQRDTPYKAPVRNDQEIIITDEGYRIAALWKALNPQAA